VTDALEDQRMEGLPQPSRDDPVRTEPSPRRVRAYLGNVAVADSARALLLLERQHLPVYYFPPDDVRTDLLEPTSKRTHCPYKGEASYWTIRVGDKVADNAVWSYQDPLPGREDIRGYLAFYWHKLDNWFEEDEEVYVHPRDPYKRVDVLASSRHVRVELDGELLAETRRPRLLFETGLPTRYYIPRPDVRMELLEPTDTTTQCPYKGVARYWSARIGDTVQEDLAWSYPFPIPECPKIEGLISFFNERTDIWVDGEQLQRPLTPWTRRRPTPAR
jgi:uncharacterized protein (DUF427 family)